MEMLFAIYKEEEARSSLSISTYMDKYEKERRRERERKRES